LATHSFSFELDYPRSDFNCSCQSLPQASIKRNFSGIRQTTLFNGRDYDWGGDSQNRHRRTPFAEVLGRAVFKNAEGAVAGTKVSPSFTSDADVN